MAGAVGKVGEAGHQPAAVDGRASALGAAKVGGKLDHVVGDRRAGERGIGTEWAGGLGLAGAAARGGHQHDAREVLHGTLRYGKQMSVASNARGVPTP